MACSHCLQKVDAPLKSFKKFFFNRSQRKLGRFSSLSPFLLSMVFFVCFLVLQHEDLNSAFLFNSNATQHRIILFILSGIIHNLWIGEATGI